jgi:hypothetical protein
MKKETAFIIAVFAIILLSIGACRSKKVDCPAYGQSPTENNQSI